MNPLAMLPLAWRLGIYAIGAGVILATVGGVYLAWQTHERRIGWDGALAKVAAQDLHAKAIATKAAQDVDTCERNGGSFDVSTGDCL